MERRVCRRDTDFSAPTLAHDCNATVISAEDPSNSLDFYRAVTGTTTSPREVVAGPRTTVSAPAETVNGGLLNIAVEDPDGNLDFWWQDSSGTFHGELVDTASNV